MTTDTNIELNEAKEYLMMWENDGIEKQLQIEKPLHAAQVYALIAVATELQKIAHKLGGIETELQNLRGRMP